MSPGVDLSPMGRLTFELYARLIGAGTAPADAFIEATRAVEFFAEQSAPPEPVGGNSLGDVNAQLEEAAWARLQKVTETAQRLYPNVTETGRAQLVKSVTVAEANWLAFGTFRLREALGQWKPKPAKEAV